MSMKNYTALIAEAEDAGFAEAEQSRQANYNAQQALSDCEGERESAEDFAAAIRASWQHGSDDYSLEDYTLAMAAIERATLREKGAQQQASLAQRAVVHADSSLAIAVADLIREVVPETANVVPTFVSDHAHAPRPDELPVVLVVQTEPATRLANGCLQGRVTVRYLRSRDRRRFELAPLRDIRRPDYDAIVSSLTTNAEDTRDTFGIEVHRIAPSVPVLAHVAETRHQALGQTLAAAVANECKYANTGIRISREGVYKTSHIELAHDAHAAAETVDSGERKLTIDASLTWQQTYALTNKTVHDVIGEQVRKLDGSFVPGLGRVASLRLINRESELWHDNDRRAMAAAVETESDLPTDTSLVGYEALGQVVIRAVLTSKTL